MIRQIPRKYYDAESGFTLLELLVALSLAAILFILLSGGIQFSTAAWRSLEYRSNEISILQTAQSSIRRLVKKALPLDRQNSKNIDFEGETNYLQFVVTNIAKLDEPGLFKIRLYMQPSSSGQNFVIGWQKYDYRSTTSSQFKTLTLMSNVKAIRFEYFGSTDAQLGQKTWAANWKNRQGLPELISIKVSFSASDNRVWPDQYISLELASS